MSGLRTPSSCNRPLQQMPQLAGPTSQQKAGAAFTICPSRVFFRPSGRIRPPRQLPLHRRWPGSPDFILYMPVNSSRNSQYVTLVLRVVRLLQCCIVTSISSLCCTSGSPKDATLCPAFHDESAHASKLPPLPSTHSKHPARTLQRVRPFKLHTGFHTPSLVGSTKLRLPQCVAPALQAARPPRCASFNVSGTVQPH